MKPRTPFYESSAALEQYLFFHYGRLKDYLPAAEAPRDAFGYPVQAPRRLIDFKRLPKHIRALDLGCATGATSFELSRRCREVVGIDLSAAFIRAARRMQREGSIHNFRYTIEGARRGRTDLRLPAGVHPAHVAFRTGDAMRLPASLGSFDLIVMLNLIDRLPDPAACLKRIERHLRPGGQLVIASPYTWMAEYTPSTKWLGARGNETTRESLSRLLAPSFRLLRRQQIPFIIREHSRKYQWSLADGSTWIYCPGKA